jgi:hypothetical protein
LKTPTTQAEADRLAECIADAIANLEEAREAFQELTDATEYPEGITPDQAEEAAQTAASELEIAQGAIDTLLRGEWPA